MKDPRVSQLIYAKDTLSPRIQYGLLCKHLSVLVREVIRDWLGEYPDEDVVYMMKDWQKYEKKYSSVDANVLGPFEAHPWECMYEYAKHRGVDLSEFEDITTFSLDKYSLGDSPNYPKDRHSTYINWPEDK